VQRFVQRSRILASDTPSKTQRYYARFRRRLKPGRIYVVLAFGTRRVLVRCWWRADLARALGMVPGTLKKKRHRAWLPVPHQFPRGPAYTRDQCEAIVATAKACDLIGVRGRPVVRTAMFRRTVTRRLKALEPTKGVGNQWRKILVA